MSTVTIHIRKEQELLEFLQMNDFQIEDIGSSVYRIVRDEELPVFVSIKDSGLYFEVDLGNISEIGSKEVYFELLDLNTEILPVSFGINNTNPENPRLVLVESRELGDLNDHELLSVFDALELAVDRAEKFLSQLIKK